MKGQIIVIGIISVVWISLVGCNSSERVKLSSESENVPSVSREERKFTGMPNPAAVYCIKLGYKYETVEDDEGNQYGVCTFPDNNACLAWDFYRGKCGQEWSHCKLCGYDLKDLGRQEGWFRGAICIDKSTGEEIGTVFDLFVEKFLSEPLP